MVYGLGVLCESWMHAGNLKENDESVRIENKTKNNENN